ncbi:MAG: FAD-dependent oxidoreductase [Candidatus Latescibacteria bacterium]|nr:FAD-dependent oxidoreductase [Candidatus Latescibacterota bacterium]NIM22501.1 FAD-dependent oxidoreductase [Candidatus Latescibacterota bacterium]NIM64815.1 FAD-dependent oxidoreductase [Candidatus Latescibacterota bacterium]NIO01323.1 FAD-dependent oxidoreductase [Candidatus Latescibacterota bacterium]NIO27812.1 FAD-dependent oxidoreductase [Candidatus Latescibacterota bacterium]
MNRTADMVIIGGGVNGVACAYYLARRGMKNIVLFEKGYLGYGATGRCGGGIRQQWGMDENIILARDSVRMFEKLSHELGFNIFFRQGGYLILISDERDYDLISKTIPRQNELGVPAELLEPKDIASLVPGLNLKTIIAGAYCPTDGTAYPYAVLWGYAEAAKRRGVDIRLHTEVLIISRKSGGTYEVTTTNGTVHTPRILNVAGAATRNTASMLGIVIPTKPYRHEIAVSEPLKSFLDPMVISIRKGFYFSQSLRGEIVGGIGDPDEPSSSSTASSPEFLFRYAEALRKTFPALGKVRIIRQWAGLYDVSPDARPIIGTVDGVDGYYHACGFSGHGFMLSPVVAKLLSELITTGKTSIPIDSLNLKRFSEPGLTRDPYVVG